MGLLHKRTRKNQQQQQENEIKNVTKRNERIPSSHLSLILGGCIENSERHEKMKKRKKKKTIEPNDPMCG